jgi:hypothetical protein
MIGHRETSAVVFRTWSAQEAELVKGLLELYGIPVHLNCDVTPIVYPIGETRILVPVAAEDEAQRILADHLAPGGFLDV